MPRPKLVALGGKYAEILAIYDEVTGNLVLAEPSSGTVLPVPLTTVILHICHVKTTFAYLAPWNPRLSNLSVRI